MAKMCSNVNPQDHWKIKRPTRSVTPALFLTSLTSCRCLPLIRAKNLPHWRNRWTRVPMLLPGLEQVRDDRQKRNNILTNIFLYLEHYTSCFDYGLTFFMTVISFTQFFLYYWSSFLNGEIESHDLKDYSTSPRPETEVLLLVIWRDGLHCFNHIPNKLFESFGVKKNPKTIYDEQKKG